MNPETATSNYEEETVAQTTKITELTEANRSRLMRDTKLQAPGVTPINLSPQGLETYVRLMPTLAAAGKMALHKKMVTNRVNNPVLRTTLNTGFLTYAAISGYKMHKRMKNDNYLNLSPLENASYRLFSEHYLKVTEDTNHIYQTSTVDLFQDLILDVEQYVAVVQNSERQDAFVYRRKNQYVNLADRVAHAVAVAQHDEMEAADVTNQ